MKKLLPILMSLFLLGNTAGSAALGNGLNPGKLHSDLRKPLLKILEERMLPDNSLSQYIQKSFPKYDSLLSHFKDILAGKIPTKEEFDKILRRQSLSENKAYLFPNMRTAHTEALLELANFREQKIHGLIAEESEQPPRRIFKHPEFKHPKFKDYLADLLVSRGYSVEGLVDKVNEKINYFRENKPLKYDKIATLFYYNVNNVITYEEVNDWLSGKVVIHPMSVDGFKVRAHFTEVLQANSMMMLNSLLVSWVEAHRHLNATDDGNAARGQIRAVATKQDLIEWDILTTVVDEMQTSQEDGH